MLVCLHYGGNQQTYTDKYDKIMYQTIMLIKFSCGAN